MSTLPATLATRLAQLPDWKVVIDFVLSKYQTTPKVVATLPEFSEKKTTTWNVFMAKELLTARAKLPPEEECVENEDTVAAVRALEGGGVDGDGSLYRGDLTA